MKFPFLNGNPSKTKIPGNPDRSTSKLPKDIEVLSMWGFDCPKGLL